MNQIAYVENHAPVGCMGMLGCDGYQNTENVICMVASAHNNFISDGIVEGSLIFIDTGCEFQRGNLNVYRYHNGRNPQYKLSRKDLIDADYIGRAVMSVNRH